MKQFFKIIFASCLGTMLAFGAVLFILFSIASAGSTPAQMTKDSVLHLKFNSPIPELTDNVRDNQFGFSEGGAIGLNDITRLIREAAVDSDIEGILLQTEAAQANPTMAYSIAEELVTFRESGKFIYAYGDYFTQSGYIIAAVADSIYLNKNGLVDLRGYGSARPYYEDFSQKTGIDFDVYHAGKYKSAIEPYYRGESSAENRYQTKEYLGDFHRALAAHISEHRDIDQAEINRVIKEGLSNNQEDALSYSLADQILYKNDVEQKMLDRMDVDNLTLVELDSYYAANLKNKSSKPNKIAVIYAEGDVLSVGETRGGITMDVYDDVFERIIDNEKIKAVVLRVNSPGGSSFTSDLFLERVKDLKDAGKYVVASFGDYAASGGYYIAAEADRIVSEPTCLTGSIGVFSMIPDFSEASEKELGIHWDTISTGKRTFLYSSFVGRSAADNALLTSETERIYRQFKEVVAQGRNLDMSHVQDIAQGRVWTGMDAIEVGLVDTLGSLADAISIAAQEVSFDDYKILEYPIIEKDFWDIMFENYAAQAMIAHQKQGVLSPLVKDFSKIISSFEEACSEPQARLPYSILVN